MLRSRRARRERDLGTSEVGKAYAQDSTFVAPTVTAFTEFDKKFSVHVKELHSSPRLELEGQERLELEAKNRA